jgi:ATP-dependent RNA/DNA helicase IGHMBP2
MSLILLEALPRETTRGTIVRLIIQVGDVDKRKVGKVEITGRTATIELPDNLIDRAVARLDGANLAGRHIRARRHSATPQSSGSKSNGDEDHFERLIRLLEVESKAETQHTLEHLRRLSKEDAERTGRSIVGLSLRDTTTGLGGRFILTFRKPGEESTLPWTRLGVGSPVLVSAASSQNGWRGVVCKRSSRSIQVALHQPPDLEDASDRFRIDLSNDEVARDRQRAALERAAGSTGNRLAQLKQILLTKNSAKFNEIAELQLHNNSLDQSQREAIQFALSAEDVAIIHGPPGTGKTTTVVECIRQFVSNGETVLATAPSNIAVDNIFEKLLDAGENAVRLGHPARVLPQLREHTLDLIVESHRDAKLARKLVKQAHLLFDKASRYTRTRPAPGSRKEMRDEARSLLADARRIEQQVIEEVLDKAKVLCATNTGLDSEILGQRYYDVAVIDEACQSVEPSNWIPLLRCNRLVLAGDHCQLPPTILSRDASKEGFGISLLERLMSHDSDRLSRRLNVQYRMHEHIMGFSSQQFYDNSLIAADCVAEHRLVDLEGITANPLTETPVDFFDTAGAGFDEEVELSGRSRLNPQEANIVIRKVEQLLEAGLSMQDMAVISPYSAQVRHIRQRLGTAYAELEVDSVDGFQGREKEAIVISLVRSNVNGEIGFLGDQRRMNVAMTRARRKLIVIGDSATISSKDFYQQLLEYFDLIGAYHSVWEEM